MRNKELPMNANHILIAIDDSTASTRAVQYEKHQKLLARSIRRGTVHNES